jgi:DNA modification methylase
MKPEGTCWLNLGDSYYGGGWKGSNTNLEGTKQETNKGTLDGRNMTKDAPHPIIKTKDLCGIPWSVAFALRADGWYLRQDIVWAKPNPMPESVTDRCTKSHEYIFLLTKSARYYYDSFAIQEKAVDNEAISEYNGEYEELFEKSTDEIQSQSSRESEAIGLQQVGEDGENPQAMACNRNRAELHKEICGELQEIGQKKKGNGQIFQKQKVSQDVKEISNDSEGKGKFITWVSQKKGDDRINNLRPNVRTMGKDKKRAELSLCNMQKKETLNERPYNSIDKERPTYSNEHTGIMPELQFKEGKQYKNLQSDGQEPNTFHKLRAEGKPDKQYLMRNRRSVWTITTKPYREAHFATFPPKLPTLCIKAGCPKDGIVMDIFAGSGTTLAVAKSLGRNYIGIELNPKYIIMAERRIRRTVYQPELFNEIEVDETEKFYETDLFYEKESEEK